ncbi:MAG TPA: PhzF family phenazine biosynthesis protein [Steroidobacteraceae bacterium]|nr:PhzF family phenazine biosynthesis protein [Steroidobacteraceae bacterium]
MRLAYRLINVFTQNGGKFTGNPLCVFEDGRGLSTEQMQALALQFNLSETTFIFPSDKATAKVRIFAPSYEMQFAGHPTLGTAFVVRELKGLQNEVSLELNVGPIPVTGNGAEWELRANATTVRAPKASRADLAKALSLDVADIGERPLWVNNGSEQFIVPVNNIEAVKRATITYEALQAVTADGPRPQIYLFAGTGTDTLLSRFFFSKTGAMIEDPATGSATANLGGWYLANDASLPFNKIISQGEYVGRPSTLKLRIDAQRNIFVAGEVVEIGRGYIEL